MRWRLRRVAGGGHACPSPMCCALWCGASFPAGVWRCPVDLETPLRLMSYDVTTTAPPSAATYSRWPPACGCATVTRGSMASRLRGDERREGASGGSRERTRDCRRFRYLQFLPLLGWACARGAGFVARGRQISAETRRLRPRPVVRVTGVHFVFCLFVGRLCAPSNALLS